MARYIDADKMQFNCLNDKKFVFAMENSYTQEVIMEIVYKDFLDFLNEQPTEDVVEVVQELWKKTANEKPDSTRHVIVANGSLISHYGYYLKPKDKWYRTYECEEEIEVPAFWMDMPEPPKESIYGECAVMDGKKVE